MKCKPLGSRVLIKRDKAPKTKGGIFLPDSQDKKLNQGTVVDTGPGAPNENGEIEPLNVKIGDRVLFGAYSGTEVNLPGSEDGDFCIVNEKEIFGVLT